MTAPKLNSNPTSYRKSGFIISIINAAIEIVLKICGLRSSPEPSATKENISVERITEGGKPVIRAYNHNSITMIIDFKSLYLCFRSKN